MSTDTTFVRSICARLGLSVWTKDLELRQIADLLFDLLGTRDVRSIEHARRLLQASPVGAVADVSVLTDAEQNRLFRMLVAYAGSAPRLAGD